jgi:hypothetical protein
MIRDGTSPGYLYIAGNSYLLKSVDGLASIMELKMIGGGGAGRMLGYGAERVRQAGYTLRNAVGTGQTLYLGAGPSYSPPAGWHAVEFDDAAWTPDVASSFVGGGGGIEAFYDPIPGGTWTTGYNLDEGAIHTDRWLYRLAFTLPPGAIETASLTLSVDDFTPNLLVYVNGIAQTLPGSLTGTPFDPFVLTLDPAALHPNQANLIAIQVPNFGGPSALQLRLDVNGGA